MTYGQYEDDGDDRYQEYKDDLAMGRIYKDGSQREPDEPDWDAIAYEEHSRDVHDGGHCDCPVPSQAELEARWAANAEQHRADAHGDAECDCVAPF